MFGCLFLFTLLSLKAYLYFKAMLNALNTFDEFNT